ncbi:putative C-type lectin domain family 20 member A [Sarcophilus harrisii]|nr:putative C-type lectin domain family 20 member A [Sarcophilus harrisii]
MAIQMTSAASDLLVGTQTFIRVEEQLTWYKAREHCRIYHTDLANMESLKGPGSMLNLYSLLKGDPAWIGLFFDVDTGTLSWSSGPIFTTPFWFMNLSEFTAGFCALLEMSFTPNVRAALCSTQHAFICYYDPAIGHLITRESPLSSSTIPLTPDEVRIGEKIFMRFTEEKTWSAALQYCQTYYTNLADLQSVTEGTPLKRISSQTEAWIGLYLDGNTGSLRWSSNFGSSIPSWLSVSMFGEGQCGTLRRFENFLPRVSPAFCSELKPFICFYGKCQSTLYWVVSFIIGPPRAMVVQSVPCHIHKQQINEGQQHLQVVGLDLSNSPFFSFQVLRAVPQSVLFTPSGNIITSNYTTITGRELSTAASPEPPRSLSGPKAVTSQASGSGTSPITSGTPVPALTSTARPTTRLGPTQSQPEPAPGSSSVFGETVGGTSQGLLASSDLPGISPLLREGLNRPLRGPFCPSGNSTTSDCTATTATAVIPEPPRSPLGPKAVTSQASGSRTSPITPGTPGPALTSTASPTTRLGLSQSQLEPAPEQSFGILKADFNSRAVLESEDGKEKFLREIQEAVKIILGHEQFRLKWISFEENQN